MWANWYVFDLIVVNRVTNVLIQLIFGRRGVKNMHWCFIKMYFILFFYYFTILLQSQFGHKRDAEKLIQLFSQHWIWRYGSSCCGSLMWLSGGCGSKVTPVGQLNAEKGMKQFCSVLLQRPSLRTCWGKYFNLKSYLCQIYDIKNVCRQYEYKKLDRVVPVDNRPSTAEAPSIGKIHTFSKIAVTLKPVMQFQCS